MKLKLEIELEGEDLDTYNGWIAFCIEGGSDLFMRGYCGYWLRGVEHSPAGWLCWEDDEQHRRGEEPNREEALVAWERGLGLPAGWFRLDEAMATKAYEEGIRRWGGDWMHGDHGDANGYDVVIQLALLGEIRYG